MTQENNCYIKPKSLYIHIPFCISKCSYCDFFSIPCKNNKPYIPEEYITSLLNELEYKVLEYKITSIKTIYIGGGTPSLLTINQLKKIIHKIQDLLSLEKEHEFTIEINPDDLTIEYIDFLSNSIINRISCGIQSLDNCVLQNVNRRADVLQNIKSLKLLKKYWKKTLSLDLICGLPKENQKTFIKNIKKLIRYKPHHISMYSLTVEKETELGRLIFNNKIDYDFYNTDNMWLKAKKVLEKKGFLQYEISNFALQKYECLHNKIYWTHQSFFAIGAGASQTLYLQDGSAYRTTNICDIPKYINKWNCLYKTQDFVINYACETEYIEIKTSIFEFFMMGLRKTKGISQNEFMNCFNQKIPENIINVFIKWQTKKLAKIQKTKKDTNYYLTKKGLLFLNQFLEEIC